MASTMTRSSIVMFAGTLVSRVLGFVRSPLLLGAVVGINLPAADAFDIANRLPNLIYMLVVGGVVNAVLVPAIVRATKNSTDDGAAFINKLLTITIVCLGVATAVLTLAAPLIVKLFAATMPPQWYALTVAFAYWCIPQVFFYGLYTVIGQILNARENFGPYMWAPALNNIVAVIGLAAMLAIFGGADSQTATDASLWTAQRVALLGGASTAGIAAQALILAWPLRTLGIRYRPDFRWRGAGLSSTAKASWWILLTMITGMIPTAILSNVAASARSAALEQGMDVLDVAGNAAYTTAYAVYSLPSSLIVVSIATAMFTRMAKNAANNDLAAVRATTSLTLRVIGALMVLSTAGVVVLAVPMVRVLAASVTMQEVVAISWVLVAMSSGLVGVGATTVLNRVYYAFEDTRGAFLISIPFQVLGVVGYIVASMLAPQWVVVGIGVTMALANLLSVPVMMWDLARRHTGDLDSLRVARTYLVFLFIGVLTAAAGFGLLRAFGPLYAPLSIGSAFVRCVVVGLAMMAIFTALMAAARMPETAYLVRPVFAIARKVPGLRSIVRMLEKIGGGRVNPAASSSGAGSSAGAGETEPPAQAGATASSSTASSADSHTSHSDDSEKGPQR